MTTQTCAEFFYPGILFAETESRPVPSDYTREQIANEMPNGAYAFRVYEVVELNGTLEDGSATTSKRRRDLTGMIYPNGVAFTPEQIAVLDYRYETLKFNTRVNKYKGVVKSRLGGWHELKDGDVVLPMPKEGEAA